MNNERPDDPDMRDELDVCANCYQHTSRGRRACAWCGGSVSLCDRCSGVDARFCAGCGFFEDEADDLARRVYAIYTGEPHPGEEPEVPARLSAEHLAKIRRLATPCVGRPSFETARSVVLGLVVQRGVHALAGDLGLSVGPPRQPDLDARLGAIAARDPVALERGLRALEQELGISRD